MTDLYRLKVSLTKHNAHKIARLLKDYNLSQVLSRLNKVRAEKVQAHKNLSVLPEGKVPDVWRKVKKLGDNAIDALVFVGIVFSHYKLIDAMSNASARSGFSGRIDRGVQLNGKAYTNFARVIDQLGFATKLRYPSVTFSLRGMFEISGLGPLVCELLGYKLVAAGWDCSGSIAEESIAQEFHRVFGVTSQELKEWLTVDIQPTAAHAMLFPKDEEFFRLGDEGDGPNEFEFRSGHCERAV